MVHTLKKTKIRHKTLIIIYSEPFDKCLTWYDSTTVVDLSETCKLGKFSQSSTCRNQSSRSKIMKAANSVWPLCILTCLTSWYQSRRTFTLIFPIKAAALVLDPPFFSFSKKWLLIKAGKSLIHALQSSIDFFVNSCLFPFVSDRILSLPSSSLTCMFFFPKGYFATCFKCFKYI